MPELPEVQTTVDGLNKEVRGYVISDVWTDYNSPYYANKNEIKSPAFFKIFKGRIIGSTIQNASRRAKNILIHLSSGETILIHMKMTGHIMCGEYVFHKEEVRDPWKAKDTSKENPLNDSFNRFIHLVFTLTDGTKTRQLVLSDMRKFGKVTLLKTETLNESTELKGIGPEPLDEKFTYKIFETQLEKRSLTAIKQALMNQSLIAGIGNIYSDEILWRAGIHPESQFLHIPLVTRKEMYKATKEMLLKGIDFGGDSMSDYRNIHGVPGEFQGQHKAYRRTGKPCLKKGCVGIIKRKVIGGRSGHFCDTHQIKY